MLRSIKNIQKIYNVRNFRCCTALRSNKEESDDSKKDLSSSIATKYQVFKNESVGVIFDIEEERARRLKRMAEVIEIEDEEEKEKLQIPAIYANLNLERGKTGVFDIEDLVEVLRRENAIDLCVIRLPKELSYVDYMVIITGSTYRHMLGMASFVRKLYKIKKGAKDSIPRIEGKECSNWMAMDLGNIALHIFSSTAREHYNLESLWVLGEEYEKRLGRKSETLDEYQQFFNPSKPEEVTMTSINDNIIEENVKL